VSLSTISRYLHWARKVLAYVLDEIPYSTLTCPSDEYLIAIGNKIAEIQNEVMRGCITVIDGSLHALERDHNAQDNFFNNLKHPDYNGWKSCYCKKGLYIFCLDDTICWYSIDCPGSWHDGRIFHAAHSFINSLPKELWILGDSAFPLIPGRVERSRKEGEDVFNNLQHEDFQQKLE
jgi:hypothetical protein